MLYYEKDVCILHLLGLISLFPWGTQDLNQCLTPQTVLDHLNPSSQLIYFIFQYNTNLI